jgi:hypothetical protein
MNNPVQKTALDIIGPLLERRRQETPSGKRLAVNTNSVFGATIEAESHH